MDPFGMPSSVSSRPFPYTPITMLSRLIWQLSAAAALAVAAPSTKLSARANPPAFVLAGDSTTAIDGGWGNGLLATLIEPATGLNVGMSGATTASFVASGKWQTVTDQVKEYAADHDVYVTISVCDPSHRILLKDCELMASMISF